MCLNCYWTLYLNNTKQTEIDTMICLLLNRTDGIGLSAPQVGLNVQLMVFNPAGESGEGEEIVLVNPKINKYSDKLVPFNEGCLSFPGIYADVVVCLAFLDFSFTILPIIFLDIGFYGWLVFAFFQRPQSVKIDARDITGARFSISLSRLPARIFQHEYDHLEVLSPPSFWYLCLIEH